MGAIDCQTFLGLLGKTCFIYTVTSVTGLLGQNSSKAVRKTVPLSQAVGTASPPIHTAMWTKGKALKTCWGLWFPGSQEPLILLICSCSCFQHSPYLHAPENHPWVSSFSNYCSSSSTFSSLFAATASLIIPLLFLLCNIFHKPATRPVFLPFFSFTLFHINTPFQLHTLPNLISPSILRDSLPRSGLTLSLYMHVSLETWFQCFFLSELCFGSRGDSSPLLASELIINSARKKKKVHTSKHKKIKMLLVKITEGKALSSTDIQATQCSTFFKVNFLMYVYNKVLLKKIS